MGAHTHTMNRAARNCLHVRISSIGCSLLHANASDGVLCSVLLKFVAHTQHSTAHTLLMLINCLSAAAVGFVSARLLRTQSAHSYCSSSSSIDQTICRQIERMIVRANLPGQVGSHLLVAVAGRRESEVVDGERFKSERRINSESSLSGAEARLEWSYLCAWVLQSTI